MSFEPEASVKNCKIAAVPRLSRRARKAVFRSCLQQDAKRPGQGRFPSAADSRRLICDAPQEYTMKRRSRVSFRPWCEPLEDRGLLSLLTPAQMSHAYGLDAVSFSSNGQTIKGDGSGQTIAIVVADHNEYLWDELYLFDGYYGLPNPNFTQFNLAGNQTNDGWAEEEAMDVEWAHVMAPGATIDVVEARSDSLADLMYAVDFARHVPGVSVVSMSWGSGEFGSEKAYDSVFTTPAGHNGVTFVAASGDSGAYSGAQWPASSPNVVAVGGTTLNVNAAGTTVSETAWSGSGGGYSVLESEPGYQTSVQSTGRRSTPDVSMDANPSTAVAVVFITPASPHASWQLVGGTSLSAQLYAGVIAVADQGRALAGKGSLDGATQTLPALYAASWANYVDVTAGSNGYGARAGYDLATGRETPTASLVTDLAGYSGQASAQSAVTITTTRTRPRTRVVRRATAVLPSQASMSTGQVDRLMAATLVDLGTTSSAASSANRQVPASRSRWPILDPDLVDALFF
jgi:subtilase family serine protease